MIAIRIILEVYHLLPLVYKREGMVLRLVVVSCEKGAKSEAKQREIMRE